MYPRIAVGPIEEHCRRHLLTVDRMQAVLRVGAQVA
jgi:hypothetical protein